MGIPYIEKGGWYSPNGRRNGLGEGGSPRKGERGTEPKEREGIIPQGQGTSGSPEGKEGRPPRGSKGDEGRERERLIPQGI